MASQINASNSGFGGIVSTGDSSGVLQLQAAGTTAVTIDTSQNVGIGTTSPTQALTVNGRLAFSNLFAASNIDGIFLQSGVGTTVNTATGNNITFNTGTTERMRIASDGTVTIPKGVSGTPAFAAYQSSAQSISGATWTKLQFQTEEYDTNNNFDTSTYRFTPTVAGYYQINGAWQFGSGATNTQCALYKNGTVYKAGPSWAGGTGYGGIISTVVYFNGSSDYVELYAYTNTTKTALAQIDTTFFNGVLVRGA